MYQIYNYNYNKNKLKIYHFYIGYQIFFEPLINDSLILKKGIIVKLNNNRDFKFKVFLSFISSDNLSANTIGGFQASFSVGHFCRCCDIDFKEMNTITNGNNLTLRNKTNYLHHLLNNSHSVKILQYFSHLKD